MALVSLSPVGEDVDDIIAEYENRQSDGDNGSLDGYENAQNDDNEAEETTARKIDPATSGRHVVRNPLPKLNTERLKGPKGIQTIEKYFESFKFHGKGHEKMDLDRVMKRMEHWGHRLFPKLDFDNFIERLEKLGSKKDLQVFIKKYRQDMITVDDDLIVPDIMDNEEEKEESAPIDEFDMLIAEQIEKQKQIAVQHDSSISGASALSNTKAMNDTFDRLLTNDTNKNAQPSKQNAASSQLSDDLKERIERNRQQAIQRRRARLQAMKEEAERKKVDGQHNAMELSGENISSCTRDEHVPSNSQESINTDFNDTL